jgi:L-alanine-DL-glutamate epimerase-like enolase superfamily enzyme
MKLLITELPDPDRPGGPTGHLKLELQDDGGASGVSFAHRAARPMIEQLMRECLDGQDLRGVAALYDRMTAAEATLGCDSRASAALDVALWGLAAERRQEPLWRALGGSTPVAEYYATVPADGHDLVALVRRCRQLAAKQGIRSLKLRAGPDLKSDVSRLECIKETIGGLGTPVTLMLDFAGAHTAKEVERRVASIEDTLELTWVEAPARPGDFLGYARVGRAVAASVCAPRGLNAASHYLPYFHAHAVDVVQLDLSTMGFTGALRIADAAYAFELPVTIASYPGNLGLHLSGTLPYFLNVEFHDEALALTAGGRVP